MQTVGVCLGAHSALSRYTLLGVKSLETEDVERKTQHTALV